jgi:hypothetical protein
MRFFLFCNPQIHQIAFKYPTVAIFNHLIHIIKNIIYKLNSR